MPACKNIKVMKNFEAFEIQFVGLKTGRHQYEYHIDENFFELFGYEEFNRVAIDVELILEKKASILELEFNIKGTVNVNCDVSNESYDQLIEGQYNVVVKFGEEYNDDHDKVVILPRTEMRIEVQQYIYETIILAVPFKKVHPKVVDGSMKSKVLDKLDELTPGNEEQNDEEIDPRWDKLKELLNENKN